MAQDDTLYHYSSDGWTFVWNPPQGPLDISAAFVQAAYVSETRDVVTYTAESLLKGASVRSHSANKQIAMAFLISQAHPVHKRLLELQAQDTDDGPRNVVGDLVGTLEGPDGAIVRTKTYVNAFIESQADETDDIIASQITWNFRANRVKKSFDQNNAEIVGTAGNA